MWTNIKLHLNYLSVTGLMKSCSMTFATQMLFRRSGSELFDTFKNTSILDFKLSPCTEYSKFPLG